MTGEKQFLPPPSPRSMFAAALVISFPLIFWNAIIHDFPMGYAGLFTQMAQQIADANFLLPSTSPYYGPGGIPFAYPPLGLYLLAFLIKLTGKFYIFLRWLPPLFSLVSVGLTFLLAQRIFKSAPIALFTAVLAAASPELYTAHAWSAGIVRAPAFIFVIFAAYLHSWDAEERTTKNTLLAGLFFGLAILSHLAYALFCFFWIAFYSLASWNWRRGLRDLLSASLLALLLSAVWIVPVLLRHGGEVFIGALNSHGGGRLAAFPTDIFNLARLIQINLSPVTVNPLLAAMVFIGLYFALRRRLYGFALFFLLVALFFPENARFVYWLGCFFAGCGLWHLSVSLHEQMRKWRELPHGAWRAAVALPLLAFLWWSGFDRISRFAPFLTESALDLSERSPEIFSGDGRYLALLVQDEAEWLPFLLAREPLVSQWGSEWLGQYEEQTRRMSIFQNCRREKDWMCVRSALAEMGEDPLYLVTYRNDRALNEGIAAENRWREVYSNRRYTIWEAVDPLEE